MGKSPASYQENCFSYIQLDVFQFIVVGVPVAAGVTF
jgi:hypothetical protein